MNLFFFFFFTSTFETFFCQLVVTTPPPPPPSAVKLPRIHPPAVEGLTEVKENNCSTRAKNAATNNKRRKTQEEVFVYFDVIAHQSLFKSRQLGSAEKTGDLNKSPVLYGHCFLKRCDQRVKKKKKLQKVEIHCMHKESKIDYYGSLASSDVINKWLD